MTVRKAFVESTYAQFVQLGLDLDAQPFVWQWWLRVEAAYKRMWPGEEMLEPPRR